jgi:hypothetical protein
VKLLLPSVVVVLKVVLHEKVWAQEVCGNNKQISNIKYIE